MMNNLIIFGAIFIASIINFQLGVAIEKRRTTHAIFKAFDDGFNQGWDYGFKSGVEQEKQRSL